jgi:serine/threonine protein kinase
MSTLIGKKLGNYKIATLLGQGGMAAVYRARQESMGRDVALKVIDTSEDSKDFAQKFQTEARTIASLSHPHIIKVFDYGLQDQYAYLVMELLPGGTLSKVLKKGPLPVRAVYRVLQQLCEALDYAHVKSIVHRDLKPQNVLLDENRNVILTDFGIARLLQRFPINLTIMSESVTGTPAYMAPEQWRNESITPRTDIYALGVMTFEMLSGRLPFAGGTPKSMMYLHTYHNPPHIRSLRPEVPDGIEKVILRAMAKDPAHRYPTAGDLLVAFRDVLGGAAAGVFTDPDLEERLSVALTPGPVRLDPHGRVPSLERIDEPPIDPTSEAWFVAPTPALAPNQPPAPAPSDGEPNQDRALRKVSVGQIRQLSEASKGKRPVDIVSAVKAAEGRAGSAVMPAPALPSVSSAGSLGGASSLVSAAPNGRHAEAALGAPPSVAPLSTAPAAPPGPYSEADEADVLRATLSRPDADRRPTITQVTQAAQKAGLTPVWLLAGMMAILAILMVIGLLLFR